MISFRFGARPAPALLLFLVFWSCSDLFGPGADRTLPEIALLSPSADAVVEGDSVTVAGAVSDDRGVARVLYRLNGGAEQVVPVDSGKARVEFRFSVRGLKLGSNEVAVRVYDLAGNEGEIKRTFATRDMVDPSLVVESPAEGETLLEDAVVVRAVAEDNWGVARLTLSLNGGPAQEVAADSSRKASFRVSLTGAKRGTNEVMVVAHDLAQRADTVRRSFLVLANRFDPSQLRLREVASGLGFPISIGIASGDSRLFVVEKAGRIRIVENGKLLSTPFLDISSKVLNQGERGFLGLAFHPKYAENGLFYVNYSDKDGNTRVERYRVSADRNRADAGSAFQILFIEQPGIHHKAGTMLFGADGMLYIATGDGVGAADYLKNAPNPASLLGKLLRIDVDGGSPYRVPGDNPFVGKPGARGEVWALGLRNPWRFSIDQTTGMAYIGDVGEDGWEEINVIAPASPRGPNFGWPAMEGSSCFAGTSCDPAGLVLPVVEYSHAEGCSVTGGVVYRGKRIPWLQGHYVYTDFCKGTLRSFRLSDGRAVDQRVWNSAYVGSIAAIVEDAFGELYLVAPKGNVYVLEPRP